MISIHDPEAFQHLLNTRNPQLTPYCQVISIDGRAFNVDCRGFVADNGHLVLQMSHPEMVVMSTYEHDEMKKWGGKDMIQIPQSIEQAKAMARMAEMYLDANDM